MQEREETNDSLVEDLIDKADEDPPKLPPIDWKEAPSDTEKRHSWELNETKHMASLKKAWNEASFTYWILKVLIIAFMAVFVYGVITGQLTAIIGAIGSLILGGSGTLAFRNANHVDLPVLNKNTVNQKTPDLPNKQPKPLIQK